MQTVKKIKPWRSGYTIARRMGVVFIGSLFLLVLHVPAFAGAWDMEPAIPNGDPQWDKVKTLWAGHYGSKNLDELIAALEPIKAAQPGKIEPILWLARVHYLHARYTGRDRAKHFELSEGYIKQALSLEPKNQLAIRMLADTMCYGRDREYIFKNYGQLFKSAAPLPMAEALPDMKECPRWGAFQKLWEARIDVEKAKSALSIMEQIASDNPKNGLAQLWLSRGYCYIGECYTSADQFQEQGLAYFQKGVQAGKKALELFPKSVPAHYWYQLNLADTLQQASLLTMARNLMPLLENLLYCSRENSIYFFVAPAQVLSGMIVEGGWVCERGMRLAGITTAMDQNGLELAEIAYPDFFPITYARANLLVYQGKRAEARALLQKLLARSPDTHPLVAPENRNTLKDARRLYDKLKSVR